MDRLNQSKGEALGFNSTSAKPKAEGLGFYGSTLAKQKCQATLGISSLLIQGLCPWINVFVWHDPANWLCQLAKHKAEGLV